MISFSAEKRIAKLAAALVGWGALVWVAVCLAPYLYAANQLIEWR